MIVRLTSRLRGVIGERRPQDPRDPWWTKYPPQRARVPHPDFMRAKRAMDVVVGILALPVVLPVFALCALAIRIDSPGGPIVFRQPRTGKAGRPFAMYKFRTMVPDAEQRKKELAHLNELQAPDFKITNDPRITRVGRFLRKTSLDELPQLINVLKGDMSLVGPRPTSFAASTYALWQTERLDVRPGVTGLWQIVGRGHSEFDDRVRLDVAYIDRACLALDVEILTRTILAVVERRGAK